MPVCLLQKLPGGERQPATDFQEFFKVSMDRAWDAPDDPVGFSLSLLSPGTFPSDLRHPWGKGPAEETRLVACAEENT
jgi:hypothetical protein